MARGYSLLELVIVLAIMGLIAALAAPLVIGGVERMTLATDARALSTRLRELRDTALDEQRDIVLGEGDLALSPGTTAAIAGKRLVIAADGTAGATITLTRGGSSLRVAVNRVSGRITVESAP